MVKKKKKVKLCVVWDSWTSEILFVKGQQMNKLKHLVIR